MASKAEFDVPPDCMVLTTKTNGDILAIGAHDLPPLHLGIEAAANLAGLINSGATLRVVIKEKE